MLLQLRLRFHGRQDLDTQGSACHVVTVLAGSGELMADGEGMALHQWDTLVVPAASGRYAFESGAAGLLLIVAAPLAKGVTDAVLDGLGVRE